MDDAFDGGATDAAGLIFTIIDVKGLFEIAGFATFVKEVAQSGAAHFDGGGEHFLNGFDEFYKAGEADLSCGERGADAGHEKRFTGVDVADTHDDMAVHDEALDGGAATP